MKYKAIVFDLDGTLVNTIDDLTASVNLVLKEYGQKPVDSEKVRLSIGYGIRQLLKSCFTDPFDDSEMPKIAQMFKDFYNSHDTVYSYVYPGMHEILAELGKRGVKCVVNTNKYQAASVDIIDCYFPGVFSEVYGEGCGFGRKPEPGAVYDFIEKIHGSKETTLYVGDSEPDINTARNAGIDCLLVSWGARERTELEKLKPDYLIDSADEFFKVLDK